MGDGGWGMGNRPQSPIPNPQPPIPNPQSPFNRLNIRLIYEKKIKN